MQTYSTKLPLDYHLPRHESSSHHKVFKWTFNYDFCVRVTAYPLGAPNISKQKDLDDHHSLLRSLTDGLNLYEAFPEFHLNFHQLEILEELKEYMHFKFFLKKLIATKN